MIEEPQKIEHDEIPIPTGHVVSAAVFENMHNV